MAIKVEQALVKANEQNFDFRSITIGKRKKGLSLTEEEELYADVYFDIKDENGTIVATERMVYTGENYNTFWSNFNSGQFLYEELVSKKSIQLTLTNAVEADFLNS